MEKSTPSSPTDDVLPLPPAASPQPAVVGSVAPAAPAPAPPPSSLASPLGAAGEQPLAPPASFPPAPTTTAPHAMDVRSLIREVCSRKGRCEVLDLGSGAPGAFGNGSYKSFGEVEAARRDGMDVALTAVDVIWPPMSLFLEGQSPYYRDYDFPGVALALRGQGVECVGAQMDLFISESARGGRKWDIILCREVYSPYPYTAPWSDWRALMHPDAYILRDVYPHPDRGVGILSSSPLNPDETSLSLRLLNRIAFAERMCKGKALFRAVVSLERKYVVVQATEPRDSDRNIQIDVV